MRIGLVVWSLYTVRGGIERLGAMIAEAMVRRGHEVVIFCQDIPPDGKPQYPIPSSVECISLNLGAQASVDKARRKIVASNLDVICALFSWDALLWLPSIMNHTGIPLVISEHSKPEVIEKERWNAYERRACLAAADKIHMLTADFWQNLPEFLRERAVVIPNPVLPPLPVPPDRESVHRKQIIAAGRMIEDVKQFSLLLRAFKLLASRFPDWDLCLCGDGVDRAGYERLVHGLHLEERVMFPGMVENIDAYYAKAHVFCIPSRYEGFGMVIVEAQRHGLPAVGFADCTGTNEIIVHGENGLLAPERTPAALAATLQVLLRSAALRDRMGRRAQELLARYDARTVMDQWENLLTEAAALQGRTRLQYTRRAERTAVESALREILEREHPFSRPACVNLEREASQLRMGFQQAVQLLQRNNILT